MSKGQGGSGFHPESDPAPVAPTAYASAPGVLQRDERGIAGRWSDVAAPFGAKSPGSGELILIGDRCAMPCSVEGLPRFAQLAHEGA